MINLLDVAGNNFYDVIGLLGVLFYVASYSALQFGKLDGNSIYYCVLNGIAASLVLVSLTKDFNLASAIIQIVWISVSLCGLVRFWKRRMVSRVSRQQFLRTVARSRISNGTPAARSGASRKGLLSIES